MTCRCSWVVGLLTCLVSVVVAQAPPARGPASKPSERESRLNARANSRINEEAADLFRMADTTFLVGDLNRASELFSKVLQVYPGSNFTVRSHARVGDCAFEAKRYVDAAAHYRRASSAAESAANDDETSAGVRADYLVGLCYLNAKTYTQAFSQFRKFIDRHPGHVLVNQAYQAIGDAHLAMDQHQQALRAYRMVGTVIGEKTAAHRRVSPGQRLYLRVTDADVNVGEIPRTVFATIKTTSGDVEVVELEPMGQRSPMFLATIPSALGMPRHSGELKEIFSEATAAKIREQLIEADKLERAGTEKAEEAMDLERSKQKDVNPAATEKKRAELSAASKDLLTRGKALKMQACKAIDAAYAAYEAKVAAWEPEQSLAALTRPLTTAPTTKPSTGPADQPEEAQPKPSDIFREAAAKPLTGTDEDDAQTPAATTSPDVERRGMTEGEILQVRKSAAKTPTNMENVDVRLSTLSVWGRSLIRQFQRVEITGRDRIEIEYFDEVGPGGPNKPANAIRKDVVEVASDGMIDLLTPDGRELLPQVVLNSSIMLRVEDSDADLSDQADTVKVVLSAAALTEQKPTETAVPATAPTTQRATPASTQATAEPAKSPLLVPEGARSVRVTLKETGPHTGIFTALVQVSGEGVIGDDQALLPLRNEVSKESLYAVRMAYADKRAIRHPDGWVLVKTVDTIRDMGGEVSAVKFRQTPLDMEAKLRRAVAAGEIGKIYLDLGLTSRGRAYLASAQRDCDEVARTGDKTGLAEDALHHSWRIYFYAGLLDEAVTSCRTLMARYPNSTYIDEAMFAMGKASLERGQRQIDQDSAAGLKASLNRDLSRAVSQFDDLVKRFPKSPLAPEALYMIGQAKIAAGQTGLDVFERLAKQYPDSVLAARGLTTAATYYVSIGDHRRAADYYGRVLVDYPDSPDLGKVLLERGKCQYKLGQNAEALQTFYRVIEEQSGTPLAAEAQKHIGFINQKRGGTNE